MRLTFLRLTMLTALWGACGSDAMNPMQPGSDLAAFRDIDGFMVASLPGNAGTARLFDPRTGGRGGVLDLGTRSSSGFAPSPDGRTIAAIAGGSEAFPRLHVYEIVRAGDGFNFAERYRADVSLPTAATGPVSLRFDRSGRWLYGDDFVVDAETGDPIGCERPSRIQPFPDGHHVVMACGTATSLPRTALYDDGRLVWVDERTLRAVSHDGQWVTLDDGVLHVETRTVIEGGSGDDGVFFRSPDGRTGDPVAGRFGAFCGETIEGPPANGAVYAWNPPNDPMMAPLPLGEGGAFLEIPDRHGLTIFPLGFDATGTEFMYLADLTEIQLVEVERCDCIASGCVCVGDAECRDLHVETRLRRAAVDGSYVRDFVFPEGHFAECSPAPHEPTRGRDPRRSVLEGPGGTLICPHSALPRARRFTSTLVGDDSTTELLYGGQVYSPGRRASLTDVVFGPDTASEATLCLQRVDRLSDQACTGSFHFAADGNTPVFWTGWGVEGGGGHAGAVIYRASHDGAPVGSEVTLFGAGLGEGGMLRIGDFTVPGSHIVSWSETRIVFTMPEDAPPRPAHVTLAGGLDSESVVVPTLHATSRGETSLRAPERIVAPRGSVFIPVEGSTAPDMLTLEFVDFYDPGGDLLAPNPYTIQRVEGGFVIEIADPQPVGEVAVRIADGIESRIVFLNIDGSIQSFEDAWVTRHHGLNPLYPSGPRGLDGIVEVGGRLVIPSNDSAHVLLDDGSAKPVEGLDYTTGSWTRGIGEPHVLDDERGIRRVGAWITSGPLAQPEQALVTRLDLPSVSALTRANAFLPWAANETAGAGMFVSARTCLGCEPDHRVSLSSFDATPLSSPDRESVIDVHGGRNIFAFEGIDLATMQVHVYSGDAATFGAPLFVTAPVARGAHVVLQDAIVTLSDDGARVMVHAGVDAPGTWVDAGISDGLTLGATSDGALALVGTATGEVLSVDPTGVVASLGSVPGWEAHAAETILRSEIAGNADLLVWLVQVPNPRLYLRRRP